MKRWICSALFGPIEMFGRLKTLYRIQFASLRGGIINNQHGVALHTVKVDELVHMPAFLTLQQLSQQTEWVLSVCTGSALLAKAGLLDGKRATSNKRAWAWVISQSDQVKWIPEARWVIDGKFYTSSGVSAGMDMALGFIADQHG
ncbi:DJ-1/PfpI family protein [Psychrobacter pocilloporae]|uniref:DJ-1/PfpI family protein n=1 Tax=Psychrobacter TaxID=497 RepID=UPI001E582498|nr:DJ-1/PfpI family protein [Psychrobacter sp. KCTC 72983]